MELPQKSSTAEKMIMRVESYLNMDTVDWKGGKVQGAVYDFDEEIIKISSKAYEMFMWSNPLHADVFKGVRKMGAEVLAMVLKGRRLSYFEIWIFDAKQSSLVRIG